jgi:hypothetical protein
MQLRGAGVLFVARVPIHYQKGCGVGRPRYHENVLLVHRTETDHMGTWTLPELDIAGDAQIDTPVPFGDVLLARCDAEFKPAVDDGKFDVTWTNAEFAVSCEGNHPDATAAIQQFLATQSDSRSGEVSMEDRSQFTAAQAKAQAVAQMFGDSAPGPLQGERLQDYRVRLVSQYQKHSCTFKDANLGRIGDPATLTGVENQIFADAAAALHDPSTFAPGELRPIVTRDQSGREITRYIGHEGACWDRFHQGVRHVRRFVTPGRT